MKISTQNMVISIASGLIVFAILAPAIKQGSLIVAPAVTAILWAFFSKREASQKKD